MLPRLFRSWGNSELSLPPEQQGNDEYWARDADALGWLAEQADGWWHWPKDASGPKFCPLDEWRRLYQESRWAERGQSRDV